MTTNHRPTLESKRGRGKPIGDSIQHARALKGQTSLKLRPDIEGAKVSSNVVKRALEEPESSKKKSKPDTEVPANTSNDSWSIESGSVTDDEREEGENEESREVIAEVKRDKAGGDDLRSGKSGDDTESSSGRRSWRKTPFRKKGESEKSSKSTYTTDSEHSDTHQKFLSRYIR